MAARSSLRWGLPTPRCEATRWLLDEYPRLLRHLRDEGRVHIHCSREGALGNYLRTLPTVLVVSVILERALIIWCDESNLDLGRPVRLDGRPHEIAPDRRPVGAQVRVHGHLGEYFAELHFDWSGPWRDARGRAAEPLKIDLDDAYKRTGGYPLGRGSAGFDGRPVGHIDAAPRNERHRV